MVGRWVQTHLFTHSRFEVRDVSAWTTRAGYTRFHRHFCTGFFPISLYTITHETYLNSAFPIFNSSATISILNYIFMTFTAAQDIKPSRPNTCLKKDKESG